MKMKKNKKLLNFNEEKEEDQEPVLGISDDEDSESDDELENDDLDDDIYSSEEDEFGNVHEIRVRKQEMDSDLDENDGDDIPNVKAWGSKARKYFGTDYVDKDGAGITEKDRRIAEVEEEEGIAAQKRLIDELNESAIDFDCFEANETEKDKDVGEEELDNLDSLSAKEKEDFLRKQSPEFFIFKQDYVDLLNESKTKLSEIIKLSEDTRNESFKGSDLYKFIVAKDDLIRRYCVNISFYMLLKTKGINVKTHPIRPTLNLYRRLCKQTDDYLESMGLSNLDLIIEKLKKGDFDLVMEDKQKEVEQLNAEKSDKENKKRKATESTKKSKKKKVKFADENDDELISSKALSLDQQMNSLEMDDSKGTDQPEEEDKEYYSDEYDDEKQVLFVHKRDDVKKRRISRMIEKNKGLTPYRKRDYRNPRVRYKSKYKKAEVKRKSQVKEPVKEVKKYSGEYHGIKTSVVRSVRFKQ